MRPLCCVLGLLICIAAGAAINAYEFADPADEARFNELINELRCPKCQNQNIASSDAPLAADLRQKVYGMVTDGRSNDNIIDYMVERYGDFITYRPRLSPATWVLWFGPLAVIGLAACALALWVRTRSAPAGGALSAQEQARLDALLNHTDGANRDAESAR